MGKKKTRAKHANHLDVTRVKQMLKDMKDDDLNKKVFSVNKGKANDNFLQVEKVKTVTRVKPADNQ